jgi:mannose-1-phosphate guanylyltransferase
VAGCYRPNPTARVAPQPFHCNALIRKVPGNPEDFTLKHRLNTWALVLAGGEGTRLQGLTRNVHGVVVPKQFCSLQGGPSLLQEALQRAATVAPMTRVCTVVAAQHRHWWTSMLSYLPERNVFVQPQNRGTAHGILLPLLRILDRDPHATLVMVPADHYLRDEEVMIAALRQASELAHANPDVLYLLGIEPEEADPELGYILPASRTRDHAVAVLKFIEKPGEARAQMLVEQGALWNSFVIAASARALFKLFEGNFHSAITAMRNLNEAELDMAYQHLRGVDFSRDVLQGNEGVLQVVPVPPCGWTDLGTPRRVDAILSRLAQDAVGPAPRPYFPTHLNLSQQILRQRA